MIKYVQHPVRLLFVAHTLSILIFCYLYWHNNSILLSETAISATTANPFLPTLAKEITSWLQYISSLAILYFAFLAGLKMVSSISFRELLTFVLITTPVFCFTMLLLGSFSSTTVQAYLLSTTLILLSFGLLKISGHWNNIADGLPD
jgi:hypothetical protein